MMILVDFDVYLIKKKSDVEIQLKHFAEIQIAAHTVKELLTDNGREFRSQQVKRTLNQYIIRHRLTMPYSHQVNSCAEWDNRTINGNCYIGR